MYRTATAPTSTEHTSDGTGHRPWGPVLRASAVVAGVVGAAVVFVVGGLLAVLTGCNDAYGDTSAFCPRHEDLATGLEIAALAVGVGAPLAGGIASSVTSHPRWLAGGYAIGLIMFAILYVLATAQQPLLS